MSTTEMRDKLMADQKQILDKFLEKRESQLQCDKLVDYAKWYQYEIECAQLISKYNAKTAEINGLALGNKPQLDLFKYGTRVR